MDQRSRLAGDLVRLEGLSCFPEVVGMGLKFLGHLKPMPGYTFRHTDFPG